MKLLMSVLMVLLLFAGIRAADICDIAREGIDRGFPGYIVGVENASGIRQLGASGYSVLETKIRMTPQERFHIASVTKLFTAVAVLQLVDEEKIKLDEKVVDILSSELVKRIPNIEVITVAQLLNHTSGIYGFNNDPEFLDVWLGKKYEKNKRWTTDELLELVLRRKPYGPPGEYHYGDTNYVLLGMIVEEKTGKPLRQLVVEKIIEPLSLNDTGFMGEKSTRFEKTFTVNGYLKKSEIVDSVVSLTPEFKAFDASLVNTTAAVERNDSAAGIVSSASDLLNFGRAIADGKLLSSRSLAFLALPLRTATKENPNRSGVLRTYKSLDKDALIFASGDGPAGINIVLAYHPKSKRVMVTFTNVFGMFDEKDFMRESTLPKLTKLRLGKDVSEASTD